MVLAVSKQGKGIEAFAGDFIQRNFRWKLWLHNLSRGIPERDGEEFLDVFCRDNGESDLHLLHKLELAELCFQFRQPVHVEPDGEAFSEERGVHLADVLVYQVEPHVGAEDRLIVPEPVTMPSVVLIESSVRTPVKVQTGSVAGLPTPLLSAAEKSALNERSVPAA